MKLVSACLLGINCNFEGKNWLQPQLLEEFKKGELFPVCPEVLGGLSVPRVPAEIPDGDGLDVIDRQSLRHKHAGHRCHRRIHERRL